MGKGEVKGWKGMVGCRDGEEGGGGVRGGVVWGVGIELLADSEAEFGGYGTPETSPCSSFSGFHCLELSSSEKNGLSVVLAFAI